MATKAKPISRVMSSLGATLGKILRVDPLDESASVARGVLGLLGTGISEGALALQRRYPHEKVNEFVDVTGEILAALKNGYETNFATGSVTMSMRVNNKLKQFELIQHGRTVTLHMDKYATRLNHTTLTQLYLNLREDIITFAEVYGKDLQLTARSCPAPNINASTHLRTVH